MRHHQLLRRSGAVIATGVALAVLAGCSSSPTPSTSGSESPESPGVELTPPAINTAGVLSCSGDFGAAPNQYQDDTGENAGVNVDIMTAVSEQLGLDLEWQDIAFGNQIAALQADRVDMMCTSTIVRPERLEIMYMVPYIQWGRGFLQRTGDDFEIDCPDGDLNEAECYEQLSGLTIVTGTGSVHQTELETWDAELTAAGLPGITVMAFDNQAQAAAALARGEGDLSYHEDPQLVYFEEQFDGDVEIVFSNHSVAPVALTFLRDDARLPLAEAVQGALEAMREDGSYDAIVERWNLTPVDSFDFE